jgi:tetratricopeptide (TPR) repeat protein
VNTFYNIAATTLCFFLFIFVQYLYTGREGAYVLDRKKTGIAAVIAAAVLVMFIAADGRTMASNVYLKKAVKEEKDRDFVSAIAHYDRIISMKPVELCPQTDVAQYYYAAEAYRESGDLKKAQEYYAEDLKINPYCPEVNNMLGAVTGQLGGIEQAIGLLKLSIYIAPHYDAAYMNLATAYASKKDYGGARNIIEKYINENGHDQKGIHIRGGAACRGIFCVFIHHVPGI